MLRCSHRRTPGADLNGKSIPKFTQDAEKKYGLPRIKGVSAASSCRNVWRNYTSPAAPLAQLALRQRGKARSI